MVNWREETKELKEKYENAVADYETTMSKLQKLKKENKILRKNAENNDKVVDKINWENQLLKTKIKNAIEYINKYENIKAYYEYIDEDGYEEYNYNEDFKKELLHILQGENQ